MRVISQRPSAISQVQDVKKFVVGTFNQNAVSDIADTMTSPPASIDDEYVRKCKSAASRAGNPSNAASGDDLQSRVSSAAAARNNLYAVISYVEAASAASIDGINTPSNPYATIALLNASRGAKTLINVTDDEAVALLSLVDQWAASYSIKNGVVPDVGSNTQIVHLDAHTAIGSSFAIELGKISGQIANVSNDPFSVFDFTKRFPMITFTLDYAPLGRREGSIVGWTKVADASGYNVKRTSLLTGLTSSFTRTNEEISSDYASISDYVQSLALPFYSQIEFGKTIAVLDKSVNGDDFYVYTVRAYQAVKNELESIFDVDVQPANLTNVQRDAIFAKYAQFAGDMEFVTVSPYPFIAWALFGDSRLDWVLAGINARRMVLKTSDSSSARDLSYLSAMLTRLFSMMDSGDFFIPADTSAFVDRVSTFVSRYGVMQTIKNILSDVGVLTYWNGTGAADPSSNALISAVLSAVDPETGMLDLNTLSSTIPESYRGEIHGTNMVTPLADRPMSGRAARNVEMVVTGPAQTPETVVRSEDAIQFAKDADPSSPDVADLVTFDGISKLMRALRVFSDHKLYSISGAVDNSMGLG